MEAEAEAACERSSIRRSWTIVIEDRRQLLGGVAAMPVSVTVTLASPPCAAVLAMRPPGSVNFARVGEQLRAQARPRRDHISSSERLHET